MITLCLILCGCGGEQTPTLRARYQNMRGCDMTATVRCTEYGAPWEAVLRCGYVPDGERVVEVVSPESIAGVTVIFDGDSRQLQSDGRRLNAGRVSPEALSPADALPAMMDALRDGWTLEENAEEWNGVPCTRVTVDRTGAAGGKLFFTLWLKQSDGTPLRGEIAVEEQTVMTAEFTSFAFSDIMAEESAPGEG
ncbi:MAG: hypothetical protein IJR54_00160 [Oscillibacter sp.]|nr:hypothetical protein [Oscillibacter sp.]